MLQKDFNDSGEDAISHLPARLPAGMTDRELLTYVELITEAQAVPPCRVCGGALAVVGIGGGKSTEWACPSASRASREAARMEPRRIADAHYRDSRWSQYREEASYVRELINRFRTLLATDSATDTPGTSANG